MPANLIPAAFSAPTHFLGRQPILDSKLNVYGHELLYRSSLANEFNGESEHATRSVIDNSLTLVGSNHTEKLFFNCTRASLISGIITLLPPAQTVLEIVEDVQPDDELMESCRSLKTLGYSFALDDFTPDASKVPFLEIADFIKIDYLASDKAERQAIRELAAGRKIRFIAEKVETEPTVEEAWKEGCTFFQGYFFCRPVITVPRAIPQNQIIYMRILAELSREPSDIAAIEQLAKSEPSVCYRLLRLVNSVLYAMPSPVSSIRTALLMVGDNEFRKLITVALANIGDSPRTRSVARVALVRAKFCEFIAPTLNEAAPKLYLLGMLSLMDVILTMPMRQVIELLPLDNPMKTALLGENGPLTVALDLVRARESGGWLVTTSLQESINLRGDLASKFYTEATKWADAVTSAL